MAQTFGPIMPAPARDNFTFDFTQQIGGSGVINAATWQCLVSPVSAVDDPTPSNRIINPPTFSSYTTTALCGDMLDGAVYQFQVAATVDDGRVLVKVSEVLCSSNPAAVAPVVDPTTGAIAFNYQHWITAYPEFAQLDPDLAQGYWSEAGLLFRNDWSSPEQDPTARNDILELLTAHCASLFAPAPIGRGGGGSSALGGVLTSKSVNGVSVGSSGLFPGVSGTQAWYMTSQYGMKAWKLMGAYRAFHYIPGPQRFPNQYYPFFPWGYVPIQVPPTGNPPPLADSSNTLIVAVPKEIVDV